MDTIVTLKIILVGDSSVGKTSLLLKYLGGGFEENYMSTIGVDFKIKSIVVNNYNVNLKIMDTCGQERFKSLNKNFYSAADGIMFVFDVTQKLSFKSIDSWLKEPNNFTLKFKKILIANKIDLENIREVKKDMIENYAKKEDMIFFETSAKTGENVEESFNKLAELIISDMTEKKKKKKSEKAGLKKIGKSKKCC